MSELCPDFVRTVGDAMGEKVGEIERGIDSVISAIENPRTKEAYIAELNRFFVWLSGANHDRLTSAAVKEYIEYLEQLNTGRSTINIAMAAITKLASVLVAQGAITGSTAYLIASMPRRGRSVSLRKPLTQKQAFDLISAPDVSRKRGVRDRAILSVLVGCGLTVTQCSDLVVGQIGENLLRGLRGRGANIHDALMPQWVRNALTDWLAVSRITDGYVFVNAGAGKKTGVGVNESQIQRIVAKYAKKLGIPLSPRDLAKSMSAFSDSDFADYKARIADLERETASLRRALALKSNLPHDKLKEVVVQYGE